MKIPVRPPARRGPPGVEALLALPYAWPTAWLLLWAAMTPPPAPPQPRAKPAP